MHGQKSDVMRCSMCAGYLVLVVRAWVESHDLLKVYQVKVRKLLHSSPCRSTTHTKHTNSWVIGFRSVSGGTDESACTKQRLHSVSRVTLQAQHECGYDSFGNMRKKYVLVSGTMTHLKLGTSSAPKYRYGCVNALKRNLVSMCRFPTRVVLTLLC